MEALTPSIAGLLSLPVIPSFFSRSFSVLAVLSLHFGMSDNNGKTRLNDVQRRRQGEALMSVHTDPMCERGVMGLSPSALHYMKTEMPTFCHMPYESPPDHPITIIKGTGKMMKVTFYTFFLYFSN